MDVIIILFLVVVILILGLCCSNKASKYVESDGNKGTIEVKKEGCIKKTLVWFWSYSEMRWMVVACVVIYFASFLLASKIEIKIIHDGDVKINHDFNGNILKPIYLHQL